MMGVAAGRIWHRDLQNKKVKTALCFWSSTVVQWTLVNGFFWIEKSYTGHACNSDTAFSDLKDSPKFWKG